MSLWDPDVLSQARVNYYVGLSAPCAPFYAMIAVERAKRNGATTADLEKAWADGYEEGWRIYDEYKEHMKGVTPADLSARFAEWEKKTEVLKKENAK